MRRALDLMQLYDESESRQRAIKSEIRSDNRLAAMGFIACAAVVISYGFIDAIIHWWLP